MKYTIFAVLLTCACILSVQAQDNTHIFSAAKWIGGGDEDLPFYSQYLPVFKINFSVKFGEKTKFNRAKFIYAANDERLSDKNKNFYNIENKRDSSYICVEINADNIPAKLNIYRAGFAPKDSKDKPFRTFEISAKILNESNLQQPQRVFIHSNLGITQIFIGSETKENLVADVVLNPYGRGGDFFAYPVVGDIGFSKEISNVEIRNFRTPSNILYKIEKIKSAQTFNPSLNSMPMLRSEFSVSGSNIAKAQLHVTARGIYDFYINGERINEDYFNPGASQYNKTHFYQTYDVTHFIRNGKNAMGAILGEGWWSGASTYAGENWNFFGDRQSLLAKLVVTYGNGNEEVFETNPQTWQYYNNGATVSSSFFQGEVYDGRKEISDWCKPDFKAKNWKPASEILVEKTTFPMDFSALALVEQSEQNVRQVAELTAVSMEEVRPKVFVYDMGQNFAGIPKINLSGMRRGQKITLRFAEVKYPDLPEYKENAGMIMLENIRAAMAQDMYICGGGNETFSPRFTLHGYRFVEITGIENALPLADVKGVVLSSIHKSTAHYETSNPQVNRLWENIKWSSLSNFMSLPTDCPQRNERMGWSGDISVFSRTAVYLADVRQFLRRHLRAMRDVQRADGRFTDVAPLGGGFGSFLWGSAGITVAWEAYRQYGDTALLMEHYPAMKRYIDFVLEKYIDPQTQILVQENPDSWTNLGDWLGLEQEKNDNSLLWESYLLFDLEIMHNVANILKKTTDAQFFTEKYRQRKAFFNEIYIDKETGKTICSGFAQNKRNMPKGKLIDTQTSYVLPLAFDIVNEEIKQKFVENFISAIERENTMDDSKIAPPYSLLTGFIGTAWMNKALSDVGRSDLAYRLLQQTSYPSWIYPITQGATTIWERLNSYTHERGFGGNNRMNSFNHYSFGAVGAWMIENSLGIQIEQRQKTASPKDKRHFMLKPEIDPTGQMTFARGYYDSPFGRIESNWEIKGDTAYYRFLVPENAMATLVLPDFTKELSAGEWIFEIKIKN